mgnify:FL=1
MIYYHYTPLKAFSSILQDNPTKGKEICFWATRYDCFRDKTEYKHGIAKIYPVLDDFEVQSGLQDDRKIAHFFNPTEIERALGLPVPYVISISARKDNEYMWENYSDNSQGVVLELEFNNLKGLYESALYSIEPCIYDSDMTNEELHKLIKDKYQEGTINMLYGNKELALALLVTAPQDFVKFIAMYLLAFVAPRFKKDDFALEEETRIIISSPKLEYINLLNNLQMPHEMEDFVEKVKSFVNCEKQRPDNNNFFREIFMPISVLKQIFVKKDIQRQAVEDILRKKGFGHIPVEIMA